MCDALKAQSSEGKLTLTFLLKNVHMLYVFYVCFLSTVKIRKLFYPECAGWHIFPNNAHCMLCISGTLLTKRKKSCYWAASLTLTCQARLLQFFAYGTFSRTLLLCGLIEWLWSGRSPSQWKFKLPADLCKLHLAWGCYKLGSLFSLWCQQNGGCQEVRGLGNVSYQGWGSPLSWACVHGTDREEWGTCTFRDKFMVVGKGSNSACVLIPHFD